MDATTRDLVRDGCVRSAAAILPVVFAFLRQADWDGDAPPAMLEVGAGEGWWSAEAVKLGVRDVYACDVEEHQRAGVEVYTWDAEAGSPLPLWRGEKRWPVALCLEMAEHVSYDAGLDLVKELTRVSDYVVWSAAIPHQGGDGHVNEQWPAFWAGVFDANGWTLIDALRMKLWGMSMPSAEHIEPWYAQNLLVARPQQHPGEGADHIPMPLVHPAFYASRVSERDACRGLA